MADFIIGAVVLVIFAGLTYNLFLRKKSSDCHAVITCAGCDEGKDCAHHCEKSSPEALKKELHKILHDH
jgi:hypothetical protein